MDTRSTVTQTTTKKPAKTLHNKCTSVRTLKAERHVIVTKVGCNENAISSIRRNRLVTPRSVCASHEIAQHRSTAVSSAICGSAGVHMDTHIHTQATTDLGREKFE